MDFQFNYRKTLQAVAELLRCAGPSRTDNYTRVLKLLYLADRKSIAETGRPITGDKVVAMDNGPVLSHVLNLIKSLTLDLRDWPDYIVKDGYDIRLVKDPGHGALSRYELDTLQRIWRKFKGYNWFDMVAFTHKLQEYKKNEPPEGSAKDIAPEDILEAVGRLKDAECIETMANDSAGFERLFRN